MKADWPTDATKAARQIAGHANAAYGSNILWIIGLDEEKGIVGATDNEVANWWRSVQSHFDQAPPALDLNTVVYVDDDSLVALYVSTDNAPFVVMNSGHKRKIDREVPWREGNSTRTARQSDLLKLLVPIVHQPQIEIRQIGVKARSMKNDTYRFAVEISTYLTYLNDKTLHIPSHLCQIDLKFCDKEIKPKRSPNAVLESESRNIIRESRGVNIEGSGYMRISANIDYLEISREDINNDLTIKLQLKCDGAKKPITIRETLKKINNPEYLLVGQWGLTV